MDGIYTRETSDDEFEWEGLCCRCRSRRRTTCVSHPTVIGGGGLPANDNYFVGLWNVVSQSLLFRAFILLWAFDGLFRGVLRPVFNYATTANWSAVEEILLLTVVPPYGAEAIDTGPRGFILRAPWLEEDW